MSALKDMSGIDHQDNTNPDSIKRFKKVKRNIHDLNYYVKGILEGNITILSKAITLIESSLAKHQDLAQEIIEKVLPFSGNSIRIGITGVPGVGKSTFIESLGNNIIEKGHKLAVLAIDPSSERTKGSILGDKTRMEKLSASKNAFIRPSPSSGTLGGVARKTRESVILCEAAGFDVVFIETVGVGQSETAVYSMVDFFLLLMLSGAGDELQGIKRGIMEMADAIAITKADGDNMNKALAAQAEYKNAVHLFPPQKSQWETQVTVCSSKNNYGINDIWEIIENYKDHTLKNNFFQGKRSMQTKYWMHETIRENILNTFHNNLKVQKNLSKFENETIANKISPFKAANQLLNIYYNNK